MKTLVRFCSLGYALTLGLPMRAQPAPEAPVTAAAMNEALQFRVELVAGIVGGTETSPAALSRLKTQLSPSGLGIDHDADFAYAAIDVGQRLIAARKLTDAELFFQQAETSLDAVVRETSDTSARDKAQFLRKLSLLRERYLNKVEQAKADIERAIALQPEDRELQRARDNLASRRAEYFKTEAGN